MCESSETPPYYTEDLVEAVSLTTGKFQHHRNAVIALLPHIDDVNRCCGPCQRTPLMAAFESNRRSQINHVVHPLLAAKADVNLRDVYGWTALMHAVQSRDIPGVRILLEAGSAVKNTAGVFSSRANALNICLCQFPDMNNRSYLTESMLQRAVVIAELLISRGANIDDVHPSIRKRIQRVFDLLRGRVDAKRAAHRKMVDDTFIWLPHELNGIISEFAFSPY